MKRIIWHWTAGPYKATRLDKKHYHRIYEGNGNMVEGDNPISANKRIVRGKPYAAHTYRSNTGSIGLGMAGMVGAKWPSDVGRSPITEAQFEACMKDAAELCREYGIEVNHKTVLSHAEVERNLGIKQKGKWDFTILPHKPELKGAAEIGDYARERVQFYLTGTKPMRGNSRIRYLQGLLIKEGYDIKKDGIMGDHTRQAIGQYQIREGLYTTENKTQEFDEDTVVSLRSKWEKSKNTSKKPLPKSRTIQGAGTAAAGGAAVLVEPIKKASDVLLGQQDAMSTGSYIAMGIGAIIILGALYAVYARWDDAGRPKFWKGKDE